MTPDWQVGDRVCMKKTHPCGSKVWEILRVGADFRLQCCGCGHRVMMTRAHFEKYCRNRAEAPDGTAR